MAEPRPRGVTGRCGGLMYTWNGCPGVPVRLTCLYEVVSAILSLPGGGTTVPQHWDPWPPQGTRVIQPLTSSWPGPAHSLWTHSF